MITNIKKSVYNKLFNSIIQLNILFYNEKFEKTIEWLVFILRFLGEYGKILIEREQ